MSGRIPIKVKASVMIISFWLMIITLPIFPPLTLVFACLTIWSGLALWRLREPFRPRKGKHESPYDPATEPDYIVTPVTEYIGKHEHSTDDLPHGQHTVETEDLF